MSATQIKTCSRISNREANGISPSHRSISSFSVRNIFFFYRHDLPRRAVRIRRSIKSSNDGKYRKQRKPIGFSFDASMRFVEIDLIRRTNFLSRSLRSFPVLRSRGDRRKCASFEAPERTIVTVEISRRVRTEGCVRDRGNFDEDSSRNGEDGRVKRFVIPKEERAFGRR